MLPLESLASVKTITISLLSSNATSATRFKYRDVVHVSRVRLYSHTKMSFYLLGGDELRIWDGAAHLGPSHRPPCSTVAWLCTTNLGRPPAPHEID